jgi:hypothetical protein
MAVTNALGKVEGSDHAQGAAEVGAAPAGRRPGIRCALGQGQGVTQNAASRRSRARSTISPPWKRR